MPEEPNAVVVSARMGNFQLLGANPGLRELKLTNDGINVSHTFPCGLTPELSGGATQSAWTRI
jgi:hypothetical protein